ADDVVDGALCAGVVTVGKTSIEALKLCEAGQSCVHLLACHSLSRDIHTFCLRCCLIGGATAREVEHRTGAEGAVLGGEPGDHGCSLISFQKPAHGDS